MKLKARAAVSDENQSYAIPPQGLAPGVLVAIVDLGTREVSYNGEPPKPSRKLFLAWELIGETNPDTGDNWIVGCEFTASLAASANLRAVAGILDRPIKDDEDYELRNLLGKKCNVDVKHKLTKKGKTVYVLEQFTRLLKHQQIGKPTNVPFAWFLDEDGLDYTDHAWLPRNFGKTLKTCIQESNEALKANGDGAGTGKHGEDDITF